MGDDRYVLSPLHLRFGDDTVETAYRDETLKRTLGFCRFTWVLTIFLAAVFGLLDHSQFGDHIATARLARIAIILASIVLLGATFTPRLRPLLEANSALYILLTGAFCTVLVALDDRTVASPYFTGLIFIFTGIYTTVGIGFRYILYSIVITAGLFLLTVGFLAPVSTELLVVYSFFMTGAAVAFSYAAYIAERVSRERFAKAEQLRMTVREVKQLSGMLPICASCKKVRDDKGYWKQIESYITEHSDAIFSHGVCPECAEELYPEFADEVTGESDLK